jgi:type III restriction enzyme
MKLKNYQQNSLDVLKRFFEYCQIMKHNEAFKKITEEEEIALRLINLGRNYTVWEEIPNTPRVCIKVPTGGGKTIIAAHSIKIISHVWCEREHPLVLWFVPSDTIRKQTVEALKNPRHPYRQALDEQFLGRVQIFDIDDKFNIRPADISNNVCIIVSTIQSFVKEKTDKYNVYKDNENLEDHFNRMNTAGSGYAGMEMREQNDRPKNSFANLLAYHRPIMIVDEAHRVVTELSRETQRRINPAAIVEFTATPRPNNNTLYSVRALELKEEEMIKLPIELREHLGWEQAVDEAIVRRAALEKDAQKEREYIRPILLFQAQSKEKDVTVEVLKKYLLETGNIPENQIKIATGEQKQLDDINLSNPDEPTRFIITVEALKEGWDCSFAYVLCSLANVQSDTAVEQLLGRVMRMPYAKERKIPSLNKAYAYVLSTKFGEAAGALVKKLAARGFDDAEAQSAVELKLSEDNNNLFGRIDIYKVDLGEPLFIAEPLTSIIMENDNKTIVFTPETTYEDVKRLMDAVPEKAVEIDFKFKNYRRMDATPSPAKRGEPFSVPRLMVELQGELVFAEPETIFEAFDWDIAEFADSKMNEGEFRIERQGNGFVIDINDRRLQFSPTGAEQLSLPLDAEVENWTPANLIYWLDRKLRQEDITQTKMVEWLRQVIEYLTDTRGIKMVALMLERYKLSNKIESKIKAAREEAKKEAFQTALFGRDGRVMLDFDNGFEFSESMYDDQLMYSGSYKFQKHYLGSSKVPMIDGKEDGEEFACAKALDNLPQVKYWLRNVSRHRNSFRLPTSTDNFYPDFVAELKDGRIFVVEYKGALTAQIQDTKEKGLIGELWEKQSDSRGLFLIVEKSKDGLDVSEQMKKKIGA